jgi:hypothetical protein
LRGFDTLPCKFHVQAGERLGESRSIGRWLEAILRSIP